MSFNKDRIKELLLRQNEDFVSSDIGIWREALHEVEKQIDSPFVFVVSGLRRVGKSTLFAQISRKFYQEDGYYYINFDHNLFLDFEAQDFWDLHEILIELFGERKVFFFDEIQNIPAWETIARSLFDEKHKVYITGSNSSLFSKEFASRLTGRNISLELFPFSFKEYLDFFDISYTKQKGNIYDTKTRVLLKKELSNYLQLGGIAQALRYPELKIHKTIYENSVYKDIVARHNIDSDRTIRELGHYLLSNVAAPLSYSKIKTHLGVKNTSTITNYIDHFEQSWLFFVLNQFSPSIKKQQMAPKKIYPIDTGLAQELGFALSENRGLKLETLVFLALRKLNQEIFYYKTAKDHEVDFYFPQESALYQVCYDLSDPDIREREVRALIEAKKELSAQKLTIISFDTKEEITEASDFIEVVPAYEFLLA